MEEKLDLIIQKLDELLYLAKRIKMTSEPTSIVNTVMWVFHSVAQPG